MEVTSALDSDANHWKPSTDRGSTFADLISVAQGSQVVHSEPDDAMGAHPCACWSLAGAINCPLVHSPLSEKYLEFLDGAFQHPPPGRGDIDWA